MTNKIPISIQIDRALKKKAKNRTQEEHLLLIKEMHKGSVRDYFLSMGEFKDIDIDDNKIPQEKKKIKIQLTRESAEELAELKISLGLAHFGDKEELIKFYLKERECLFG